MKSWNENPNYAPVTSLIFSNVILLLALVGLAVEIVFLTTQVQTLLRDWQALTALRLLY